MIDRRPITGLTIEQQPEKVVLALVAAGEARGEQDQGGTLEFVAMCAVLWTGKNRQRRPRWRGRTLREVFLERWQFSCFNENDPNRDKLLELWKSDAVSWERADCACDAVETGYPDPTGGATHYCTLALWNSEPRPATQERPAQKVQWYHRAEIEAGRTHELARIGGHVFASAP